MIKSVFFDWFNTLARYDPPREELYRKAFKDCGIDLSLSEVYKGLQVGDRQFFADKAKAIVRGESLNERASQFVLYPLSIAETAGIVLPPHIPLKIIQKVLLGFKNQYVLFEEALSVLRQLRSQGLITGIITNADREISYLIEKLNVKPHLDIIITSEDVRAEKPAAPIFLAALDKSKVKPSEMIYVGDQYQSDILGAESVGIKAILIDRYNTASNIPGCLRIATLNEIFSYL